uniref:Centromere protein L n=1 Tax=Clastoptera arizonana TaxID=38151 RepID=A0A1B6CL68_9HEMI
METSEEIKEAVEFPDAYFNRSQSFHHSMSLFLATENEDDFNPYLTYNCTTDSNSFSVDSLSDIILNTWEVYKVGPLWNFNNSDSCLKKYSNALRNELMESIEDLKIGNAENIEVILKVRDDISHSENDEAGLQVKIKAVYENKTSILYLGYLISWKNRKIKTGESNCLPILLCCYLRKDIADVVHMIFSQLFDTMFEQLKMYEEDFICFTALIVGYLQTDCSSLVIYTYRIPGRPKTESLKFKLPLNKVIQLWKSYNDEVKSIETLLKYQLSLEKHFQITFGIHVGQMNLCSMKVLNQVDLDINGTIMLASPQALDTLLRFLTNK